MNHLREPIARPAQAGRDPGGALAPRIGKETMDPFLKIAHRGYSARYPENTIPAFEKAVAAGADVI